MQIKSLTRGVVMAAFLLVSLGVTTPARSITINLTFDSGASDSPTFDSTGALLTPIMQAAANFWEDIIEDTGTLAIEYYYDNLSDPNNTLAVHNNLATSGGKPTSARVRVDTQLNGVERLWFFDPTPTNNSEYDLQQTLYRDLTGTQQTNWFNGSPPDLLEVGYRGNTVAGAPADAVNGFDLLSTVIHEIGHAVGLTSNVASGEVADGDYDFNTAFVNGAVMSVDDNSFHIDPTTALMCSGCGATNLRRMPTATDVFAAASAAGWTKIDLPRQDFFGGVNWGTAGNWEANQVPGAADWAFLRNGGNIQLNVNDSVAQLFVGEGTDLFTNAFRLDVNGTATVEHDGVAVRPQIFVETGGELEANRLDLNGGELDMSGGLADINGTLDINTTNGFLGRVTGNGTVDVSSRLNNDGEIVPDGGTLTFSTAGGAVWNLDGGGGGIVRATLGNINFASGTLTDAFDGTMTVGATRKITFAQGWEHGTGGVLNLNGGTTSTDRAEVDGGAMVIRGDINVDKRGELDGALTFYSSSAVDMPDADDRLDLGNATTDTITYNGGSFTGSGTLVQDGDATVTTGSTVNISVNTFDFDGDTISDTTIQSGATMNITGTGIADAHNGVITINSGTLNVATGNTITLGGFPIFLPTSWTMAGSLVFLDNGTDPVLTGSKVIITGAVSVPITGTGRINAPVEFRSTSNTEITSASDRLQLNGATTFDGGSFTGFGELEQNSNATVISNTTLDIGVYDWDGNGASTTTINDGVTFTINAGTIDNFDGFDGTVNVNGGTLSVNTTAAWSMEGTMNLANGGGASPTVTGQQMSVLKTINATGGQSFINSAVDFQSTAVVTVDAGSELELNGVTTYSGGSYTGLGRIKQDGNATVNAATTLDVDEFDIDGNGGTSMTLNSDLTVNATNIDIGNNIYNGTINVNNSSSELAINTPGFWTMAGTLNVTTGTTLTFPSISGQDFTLSGTANINGGTRFEAKVNLTGSVVMATATSRLAVLGGDLVNPNTINGATVSGPAGSSLRTTSGNALVGNGTITVALDFLTGSELLADNGTLSVPGNFISMGVIGTNDTDGNLRVTTAWNTSTATELRLNGGQVTGASIFNGGLTTGFGTIAPSGGFRNDSTLTASGGTIKLNPLGALDLDGLANSGTINALAGSVNVAKNLGITGFAGTLNVGAGEQFSMNFGGLSSTGQVNLSGGAYVAPAFNQFGTLTVNTATSFIKAVSTFEAGSTNTLNADLELLNDTLVRAGASFNGAGSLHVTAGTTLTALDGAGIGVEVVNDGSVMFGSSPGFLNVADFTQTAAGQIQFELQGLNQGVTYDYLKVSNTSTLDGLLDVQLFGGYVPSIGDSYEIIAAGLSVVGTFSNVSFPAVPNIGLGINYTANTVVLNAGLLGDLDGDGFVGIADLNIVLGAWNNNVTPGVWLLGDPSGDGFIGIEDLNVVLGNWNAGTPPLAEVQSLIPEPSALGLMACGVAVFTARRRRL
jgi:hypothetical protein